MELAVLKESGGGLAQPLAREGSPGWALRQREQLPVERSQCEGKPSAHQIALAELPQAQGGSWPAWVVEGKGAS